MSEKWPKTSAAEQEKPPMSYDEFVTTLKKEVPIVHLIKMTGEISEWEEKKTAFLRNFEHHPQLLVDYLEILSDQDPILLTGACFFAGFNIHAIQEIGHPSWLYHLMIHLHLRAEYCRNFMYLSEGGQGKWNKFKNSHCFQAADLLFLTSDQIGTLLDFEEHFMRALNDEFGQKMNQYDQTYEYRVGRTRVEVINGLLLLQQLNNLPEEFKNELSALCQNTNENIPPEAIQYLKVKQPQLLLSIVNLEALSDGTRIDGRFDGSVELSFALWLQNTLKNFQNLKAAFATIDSIQALHLLKSEFQAEFCCKFILAQSQLELPVFDSAKGVQSDILALRQK
jgi:hypothetical protein